jgi:hypothetical protein
MADRWTGRWVTDSAYGTGAHLAWLDQQRLTPMVKTQLPTAPGGRFAKDQFRIVRGQVLMSFLVRVHMSVAGQARSLEGTTSI